MYSLQELQNMDSLKEFENKNLLREFKILIHYELSKRMDFFKRIPQIDLIQKFLKNVFILRIAKG